MPDVNGDQDDKRPSYADLGDFDEDKRIDMIGRQVMSMKPGQIVLIVTDDEPGKPERYIEKLQAKYPGIVVLGTGPGPVVNTIGIKVSRRVESGKR